MRFAGLGCETPAGAFYFYVSCGGSIHRRITSDEDVARYLLEEGVALVAGTPYGLSPYFRVSFATSMENLEEACRRIAGAVAKLD